MSQPPIAFELTDMRDYQAAMRRPAKAFADEELQKMVVFKNSLGWPAANTGGFAAVYKLTSGRRATAVRCFVKLAPDIAERYEFISARLSSATAQDTRDRFLVKSTYQAVGINIVSGWKPITTMPWIEGRPLDAYMDIAVAERWRLPRLRTQIERLEQELFRLNIAHGDLQHRNILIEENGSLRLIDYDGMWVPELAGRVSNEIGVADYQHPGRTWEHFGPGMDRFSFLVLYLTLLAVELHPEVWRADARSEGLLLRESDYRDPDGSPILDRLSSLDDLAPLVRVFRRICVGDVQEVPRLPDYLREVERTVGPSARPSPSVSPAAIAAPSGQGEEPVEDSRPLEPTPPDTRSQPLSREVLAECSGDYITLVGRYERFSRGDGPSGRYRTLHLRGDDGARVEVIADPVVVGEFRATGRRWGVSPDQEVTATGLLLEEDGRYALLLEQAAGLIKGPKPGGRRQQEARRTDGQRAPSDGGDGGPTAAGPAPSADDSLFGDWVARSDPPRRDGPPDRARPRRDGPKSRRRPQEAVDYDWREDTK
jgi:hypothetical protein